MRAERTVLHNVRSWSSQQQQQLICADSQAMQARRHHLTGGGAHGWRMCNRLCALEGLVWVILLDGRRGKLRYATHTYADTDTP